MSQSIRTLDSMIVLPAFKPNARNRRVGIQYRLAMNPVSGDNFWTGGRDSRVKRELEARRYDPTHDAHPDNLPKTCAAALASPWKTSAHVMWTRESDGRFIGHVTISFDLPDREKFSESTLRMMLTSALNVCNDIVHVYMLQVDNLIYGIETEFKINDTVRAVLNEERERAETRINAEALRAEARARYQAELDGIEGAVRASIIEHRESVAAELRGYAADRFAEDRDDRAWSIALLAIDQVAATVETAEKPKPMLALPARAAA